MTAHLSRRRLPVALVRMGLERPTRVLAGWLVLLLAASVGLVRLDVETNTDSVLDRSGAPWAYYESSQERFGGDEVITLLVEAPEPWHAGTLEAVARMSERFEGLAGVRRVDSLATVPHVEARADGALSLEPVIADASELDPQHVAERARSDRLAPRTLVTQDGSAFAINVLLEQGAADEYAAVLAAIDEERASLDGWASGVPVFRLLADARTRNELLTFAPVTLLVMVGLLYWIFGSLRAVTIPLLSSAAGTWVVLGAMGATGTPVTISTVVLPSVLLALGTAYCMHLLVAASGREGEAQREALFEVALPVALSGLTTAVGFAAVGLVRIDAIRFIGGFGAIGVLVVTAATLTLAPAALRLWPLPARPLRLRRALTGAGAAFCAGMGQRAGGRLALGWLVLAVFAAIGIARLEVESDVVVWFPPDDPVRVSYERIRDRLSGISPMNVVVEADASTTVATPEAIAAIDALTAHLDAQPAVGRAISIGDPLRQIHGGFAPEQGEVLPNRHRLIAQYLLLLESKPYIHDLVTRDRTAANVVIRADDNGSTALLDSASAAHAWWAVHGPPGLRATTTGIMYEFARAEDEIAWGQLRGLLFALTVVGLLLLSILRWPALAAVALLPNALPVGMAFGAMGLLGIPLDAGTVLVGSLALGIAVDDTVHLAVGFSEGVERGESGGDALRGTLARILPPLVYTTAAVTLGFLALGISGFLMIRNLGLVTAAVMVLCLAADLLLLPGLLLKLPQRLQREKPS
jgi:predicted RND superfamily exporter protein